MKVKSLSPLSPQSLPGLVVTKLNVWVMTSTVSAFLSSDTNETDLGDHTLSLLMEGRVDKGRKNIKYAHKVIQ